MLTWTTYGTWLQGEQKGYVKDGKILGANRYLVEANKKRQKGKSVKIDKEQRRIVKETIEKEAERLGQKIYAIAVCSNHLHLVIGYDEREIGGAVRCYKNAGYFALRKKGFAGRLWTRGFDKRFCFDNESLRNRMVYVNSHKR